MTQPVSYREIHAYMLKKTQEYYHNPPASLVEAVMEDMKQKNLPVTFDQARKMVSPIQIQRLVKQEMAEKWPEFMASIPSNPLRDDH